MKKAILFLFPLLLLTGCNNKKELKQEQMRCYFENMNQGVEFITDVNADIENDKVKYAKATMTYQSDEFANQMCEILKQAEDAGSNLTCDGKVITIDNYHKSISEKELTKDEFVDYMERQQFTCELQK